MPSDREIDLAVNLRMEASLAGLDRLVAGRVMKNVLLVRLMVGLIVELMVELLVGLLVVDPGSIAAFGPVDTAIVADPLRFCSLAKQLRRGYQE